MLSTQGMYLGYLGNLNEASTYGQAGLNEVYMRCYIVCAQGCLRAVAQVRGTEVDIGIEKVSQRADNYPLNLCRN